MNILPCIEKRRSIRRYLDRTVEEEKLMRVLEAGRLAPSASNRQEWRFVVVRDRRTIQALSVAADNQDWIARAPLVIACCAETDHHVMMCGQPCYPIDVAIAVDHMTLQAVHEGLGSCWIGAFRESPVKEILEIPEGIRVVELLALGYAARVPRPRPRKRLDELVRFDRW